MGLILATRSPALAADDQAEIAKKLQNPIADLISIPLQNNWDFAYDDSKTTRYTLNVQPVIPFHLSASWNLITRTILPVINAESPVPGASDRSGLGDTIQSFFLSPHDPVGGWLIGVGPVFLWPTATDSHLGGEKWGVGPTFVVLQQRSGWTYGMLANYIHSYAGDSSRETVSAMFLQPFVAYTTHTFTTFSLNTETTYDFENSSWTVPFNLAAAQLIKIGKLPVQFQFGARAYADTPSGGPDWGLRGTVTLLLPT